MRSLYTAIRPRNSEGSFISLNYNSKNPESPLSQLLKNGKISPSTSPYEALILFAKKRGGSLGMCIDYRAESQTIKNRYVLPRIDDLLDQVYGAK
jgi:hypothetical protein